MLDKFEREINYLRISITDKCNLRCTYCVPEEGVPLRRHDEFLSLEQIAAVARAGVRVGLNKVRLTGGEPLVKRGIVTLVGLLSDIEGLRHLAMTTNGTLLDRMARDLNAAGLNSLNISLDTLEAERYRLLTRGGDIERVLRGIDAAVEQGFPIKINAVVFHDTTDREMQRMRSFCREKGLTLQLINHYSLSEQKRNNYRFERPPNCAQCNRIRLMADGSLKPCLHSDREIALDLEDIETCLREAVAAKPEKGAICVHRSMIEIGG